MVTTIKLSNGRTAVSFVPEDSKDLAIVHLGTIQRLASLLPKAALGDIKTSLIDDISTQCNTLEQLVDCLKDEVSFHETVNLIKLYNPTGANE